MWSDNELFQGNRDESIAVDNGLVSQDADSLYAAGEFTFWRWFNDDAWFFS